jgi:addiction module RelE/StbE family toxin
LEWKAAAQVDLLEIVDHIGAENPDAASAFAQMVYAKAEALCLSPTLYRSGRVRGTREMVVHRNYVVFYRVTADIVTILLSSMRASNGPSRPAGTLNTTAGRPSSHIEVLKPARQAVLIIRVFACCHRCQALR